mgnify:CR=1 FL=1
MNEITLFKNVSFGSIRTVQIEGEIWFVAKDILIALGYAENSNPAKVMQAIPDEWKGVKQIHTPGGMQKVLTLKEQGLYFFLGRSDKPKALPFQKWVAGDVIVSIRKTGSYGVFTDMLPKNFPEALRALAQSEEEKARLEQENKILIPKAQGYDRVALSEGSMNLTRAAKVLDVRPKQLTDFLSENKWIYRKAGNGRWLAYQDKIQAGYLTHKVYQRTLDDGTERCDEQVLIKPKGLAKLSSILTIGDTKELFH